MSRPCHIVLTTIHYPDTILTALYDNIRKFNHLDEVKVWVVGDLDTPAGTTGLAKRMPEKGLETAYLDVPAQEGWGNRFEFCKRLAYRNDARRNLGYLKALEEGCETLVSIDDDNFPSDDDLVGLHMAATGKPWTRELIREERNFHNICEYLEFLPNRPVFPRGYPFRLRATVNTHEKVSAPDGAVIGVMIGLWLGAPDVDATTWLQGEIEGVGYGGPDILVLHPDTWSPLNTQNTSVARRMIPGFLNVPMGWDVAGIRIQRYGDIWGGYLLQSVIRGTDSHVAFGRPLVHHRRNPHDYLDDLRHEFWGMLLTDWLLGLLRDDFRPSAADLLDRAEHLGAFIEETAIPKMPRWCPVEMREFFRSTAANVRLWCTACRQIGV